MDVEKVNGAARRLRRELREKITGYVIAAFGLVAGLSWNDAVKGLIDQLLPLEKNTLFAKFVYAIVITAILIIVSIYLVRLSAKEETKQ